MLVLYFTLSTTGMIAVVRPENKDKALKVLPQAVVIGKFEWREDRDGHDGGGAARIRF